MNSLDIRPVNMKAICTAVLLFSSACGLTAASTLDLSLSGQFSSGITATRLAAPDGTFTISFEVPGNPTSSSPDFVGFDTSFSSFSYTLNGAQLTAMPDFIRFATASNLGLFTLFFGPESGYDSNGLPIPEFSFSGSQAFSGSTSNPVILSGSYPVASWIYSDSINFDQHNASNVNVTLAAATGTPEPSSLVMFLLVSGLGLLAFGRLRSVRAS